MSTVILLSSACAPEGAHDVRRDYVIGGAIDEGDPATVALRSDGYFFCSGTLISPHVILTAAHCLEGGTAPQLQIFFGTDANTGIGGSEIQAAELLPHPDYDGLNADVGLVALEDASTVTPAVRNTRPLGAEMMGQDVRVVGFGLSAEGTDEAGEKRQGIVTFESVDGDYMMVRPRDGVSGCYGDSGGSNFMTFDGVEVLAGVTSFGTEDSCLAGLGGNTDVQKFASWIDEFVTRSEVPASCEVDGRCAQDCATPDPDCACRNDGECNDACPDWLNEDPDCLGCGAGDGCAFGCPASAPDPDCPTLDPDPGVDEDPDGDPDPDPDGDGDGGGDGGGLFGCSVNHRPGAAGGLWLVLGLCLAVRLLDRRRRPF